MRDRYSNQQKQDKGRIPVWENLLKNYQGGAVLLLPEKNRRELDVILSHNVNPENIYAVDKSPAIIATFTRELSKIERAGIKRRGAMASVACGGWVKTGVKLEAVHFDLTGNVDGYGYGSPRDQLERVARCGIIDNARIAITIEKGREAKKKTFKKFNRVKWLESAICNGLRGRGSVTYITQGEYQNGPSPMLWVVFQISTKGEGNGNFVSA